MCVINVKWETSKENKIFINGFEMAKGALKKSDIYSTDAVHSIAETQMKDEKIIAVNRKVTRLDLGLVVERVEIEAVILVVVAVGVRVKKVEDGRIR